MRDLNSNNPDELLIFSRTEGTLDQVFDSTVRDTRAAIGSLESIVIGFFDDNPNEPDEVFELSADEKSLLSSAIERLNGNSDRLVSGVDKAARKIEKRAC